MNAKTINEHVDDLRARFQQLSDSRQRTLVRQAKDFISKNPGAADHSTFWRGLSARQVTESLSR